MQNNVSKQINSSIQIKRGAFMSYLSICFNIASGLVYIPWMIGKIGQSEYGLYTLSLTVISLFTIDFGLGEAVSRFLSKYNVENDDNKKKNFLGITFKLFIIIDIFVFIILGTVFVFADSIYVQLTSFELAQFRIVFSIAALYSVTSFPFIPLNGVLISNERFAFQKFTDLFQKILTIFTMVLVLEFGYGLYSLVIVNAITGIIKIVIKILYVRKNKILEINFKSKDKALLKEIFSFSIWTTIIIISQRLILNITPTVLGAFAGTIQISLFSIAMVIEGYTWSIANALNGLFLPKVTRLTIVNKNSKDVENLMIKVGRIQFIITGLLVTGIFTMGREFMLLWMGENFLDSYYVTLLLISTCIITLTQQIGNVALVATNKIKYRAYCYVISAFISILLSMNFSKYWGAIGAGIAIFISNIIGQVVGMNIVYYKILKIDVIRFFKECHLKMVLPLVLTGCIGFFVQYIFPVEVLLLFMIKAFMLSFIYIFFMWHLALNKFEKKLFIEILNKINRHLRRSNKN
jgi:O-antigen/teichoic acid export membrane protein